MYQKIPHILTAVLMFVAVVAMAQYNVADSTQNSKLNKLNTQFKTTFESANFPDRPVDAVQGSVFMESISNLSIEDREELIYNELKIGNIPNFCKPTREVSFRKNGHECIIKVAPDYLAVGSDTNFCRLPLSPELAQKIADFYGCSLPTPQMVDTISKASVLRIEPITHTPNGNDNEQVWMFMQHNTEIENELAKFAAPWVRSETILDGLKKDIVITNRLATNPGKVAIYGWYKLNGTYWQPLYLGHVNWYMDYSHGVRLVNSLVYIDGEPMNIRDVLADPELYSLLSNESGAMQQPYYVYETENPAPKSPKSFGLKLVNANTVQLLFTFVEGATSYEIYTGTTESNYSLQATIQQTTHNFTELPTEQPLFVKLKTVNENGTSLFSETLVVYPSDDISESLIVQGFDRNSDGNTYDFMKYHAASFFDADKAFDAATNNAITDKLFRLSDYQIVDYVLGDESTEDETFSESEQTLVKTFLEAGGHLLVSGAEIAWDLDYKGSAEDKDFYHNYLKSAYKYDAPANASATYYSVIAAENGVFFSDMAVFDFDDGTHGTINVKYADQLLAVEGGEPLLEYWGIPQTAIAGVGFMGVFGKNGSEARMVNLGFPLEAVYPESVRNELLQGVFGFFDGERVPDEIDQVSSKNLLWIYPNPVTGFFSVKPMFKQQGRVELTLFDVHGKMQTVFFSGLWEQGLQKTFYTEKLNAGMYYCVFKSHEFSMVAKFIVVE